MSLPRGATRNLGRRELASGGISIGDRVFLLRTGPHPRGVVAAGLVGSRVYRAPHWDESKAGLAPTVDVVWTETVDPRRPWPYATLRLAAPSLPPRVMGGGIRLDDREAESVEAAWAEFNAGTEAGLAARFRGRRVTRARVFQVIGEYDELGQAGFLDKYGFKPSRRYWVTHAGREYESKAVLGVAAGLRANEFSGRQANTLPTLERLGFSIVARAERADPEPETRPAFRTRDVLVRVAHPQRSSDPDEGGRGLRAHRELENWLARQLRERGLTPVDPALVDPPLDLGWMEDGLFHVVEAKSLTSLNETAQLRRGLGQILEYAQLLSPRESVRPILLVEREPSGSHWPATCQRAGVELRWPK